MFFLIRTFFCFQLNNIFAAQISIFFNRDSYKKYAVYKIVLPRYYSFWVFKPQSDSEYRLSLSTATMCAWKSSKKIYIIFTNPSARAGYDTRSIFKRSLTGLNLEFSFSWTSCLTKAEEPSLSCYLPIAGGRITGFIPFPRVLVLCEMQLAWSRIWTRVAVSISYDDNHYTTVTSSKKIYMEPIIINNLLRYMVSSIPT